VTSLIRSRVGQVAARVNHSRWIADCLWCDGALILRPGTPNFDCPTCDSAWEVIWPSEETCVGIVRLLMMRPDPKNRNWLPGETLIDLMWENGRHGVFDGLELDEPGTAVALSVDETTIRIDKLALTSSPPKAVGV
jgi:hypothetical protein